MNKNRVPILCGKFTISKNVRNPSGILQYVFLLINPRKSVALSPKFVSVLSAGVVEVFDLLSLLRFKLTAFFKKRSVSLMSSRDFSGGCFSCRAAY